MNRALRYLLFSIVCGTALLLCSCGGSEVIATTGGSEVIGTLVKEDNTPVQYITVQALKISVKEVSANISYDTTIVYEATTNKKGEFTLKLKDLPIELYTLSAHYPGDSLILPSNITFTPNPAKEINLTTIVMRVPGAISGTVQMYGNNAGKPVLCYIAGTSFMATANPTTGQFVISNVPPDTTYTVTFFSEGLLSVIVSDVTVSPGNTTYLTAPVVLPVDPNGDVPIPSGIVSYYDTLAGVLHLKWQPVPVINVNRYIVYMVNDAVSSVDTVADTLFSKQIFIDALDDNQRLVCFQVAALNSNNNSSLRSHSDTLIAPSPRLLGFTFGLMQGDEMASPDSVPVILTFYGNLRTVRTIQWWFDDPDSIIRSVPGVNKSSGTDTLYWNSSTSKRILGVTLIDNAGNAWTDSIDASTLLPVDVWSGADSLNEERRYAGACVVDGSIIVFGGCKEKSSMTGVQLSGLKSAERLRSPAGAWEKIADMNYPRYNAAYTEFDGKIYVFGGISGSSNQSIVETTVERYDPAANVWTVIDTMESAVIGAAACKYRDGSVIFISGGMAASVDKPVISNEVHTFNPLDGTWSSYPPLESGRSMHKALPLSDNTVLIVGGIQYDSNDEPVAVTQCEYLGTARQTINKAVPELLHGSIKFGAVIVQDRLITIGGLARDGLDDTPFNTVDIFHLDDYSYFEGSPLPVNSEGMATVLYENRIFCIGGSTDTSSRQKSSKAVYVYYP